MRRKGAGPPRTRRTRRGGFCRRGELQQDEKGRNLCRCGCGQPIKAPRRTFATDACVHEWRLRTDTGYLRDQTFARDHGVCAICGTKTEEVRQQVLSLATFVWSTKQRPTEHGTKLLETAVYYRELGFPSPRQTWWNADHIQEVVRGGGECGLENIQTLCIPCHRRKTARLAAERAEERRTEKQPMFETF